MELEGYYADAAVTVGVPPISDEARRLIECVEAAFQRAAKVARAGERLSHVGGTVEAEVMRRGFKVLRDLCGHGIGRSIHEEPSVVNHYQPLDRTRLTSGLVIALEPIVSVSANRTRSASDGWTITSLDGSLTAHYEHTLVITKGHPLLLTAA